MTRKLETIAYHRNGVCGEGFYVLTFKDKVDGYHHNMMAVVFHSQERPFNPAVAVFDRDLIAKGDISFGSNSWRGDHWADWCYAEIDRHNGRPIDERDFSDPQAKESP